MKASYQPGNSRMPLLAGKASRVAIAFQVLFTILSCLTSAQQAGRDSYFNVDNITDTGSCNHCHALDPLQNQFGTGGLMSFEGGHRGSLPGTPPAQRIQQGGHVRQ